ncbi:hypothetical protein [Massilia sp. DWR3-1-1]|uniref:hypothetical protein n=1 Tax=Massilia sp. DWR3-1-1 TaxID=2804559 RepID=UPI003CF69612
MKATVKILGSGGHHHPCATAIAFNDGRAFKFSAYLALPAPAGRRSHQLFGFDFNFGFTLIPSRSKQFSGLET